MSKELLVVDDEPMICKALAALFVERGFHVTTATTAREAFEALQRVQADVVLLDLKLPDGSGLDVLTELKAKFPNLRVIVISALVDPDTIQEVFHRGANDYLAKPFDFGRCFYTAMGIDTVEVASAHPDPAALARVPAALARKRRVLPLRWVEPTLHVAMADPLDPEQVEGLRAQLGCDIKPLAAIGPGLLEAVSRCYGPASPAELEEDRAPKPMASRQPTGCAEPAVEVSEGVARLMRDLIQRARAHRATDLHLGIGPQGPWIRERIDGVLTDLPAAPALRELYPLLVSALKALAHLDVAEHTIPQEGRGSLELEEGRIDLLISVLPTGHGEHVAVRLHVPGSALRLEQLGLTDDQRRRLASLLARRSGLCLVAGPAGCGASTTLYACLSALNTGGSHLVTIEERIERELPGLTQVQVRAGTGLTYAAGLHSILRHDPNVVMVGELQDRDTARLAVRAALTGRLVLAGLHTHDAAGAVTRLLDLGIEPFFLCSTVSGILSQRLLRRLCSGCREQAHVNSAALASLGVAVPKALERVTLWRGRGCAECRKSGYHGLTGIFELLVVDHHIRSLIIKGTSSAQIRQSAVSRGMVSLLHAGWQAVMAGDTSLEELLRAFPPESR